MAKKTMKGSKDKGEDHIQNPNASSGNEDQRTAGKNTASQQEKEEMDLDKINRINQNRRGYYSRNGHGGYRGL